MIDRAEVDNLLTHLRELEQLVSGLRDKDVPVSFFGESFELIQAVSRSVYRIEQSRVSALETRLNEHRSCIAEISARLKEEEQKVKELTLTKEGIAEEKNPLPEPVAAPTPEVKEEPKAAPQEELKIGIPKVEEKYTPSLKDTLERKFVTDLRKSFSLNDRFLFKKELFGGDDQRMNTVIDRLNQLTALEEAMAYLQTEMNWDFKSSAVAAFISHLEKRFL